MKYRLLAPGPTPVHPNVLKALSSDIYHHRTPLFEEVFNSCREKLKWLFQTDQDVLTLCSSGTGAMEAAFASFFSANEKIVTIGGGKFGERWGKLASALGLQAINIEVQWGDVVDLNKVEQVLADNVDVKGVICVASETSTGVRQPYEEIGKMVKNREDCIFVVDGITAVGVWDISPEKDNIDVLVTGSQKALMMPPGLSFICASNKAWQRYDKNSGHKFYFDLGVERKSQQKNQTAFTPAVSLIMGLQQSLIAMEQEGLQEIFNRHERLAKATRSAVEALGLKIFAKNPANSLTSVYNPEAVDDNAIYTGLRDLANLTIAGGQDHLKGKIFRISHMGYFDELDIYTVLCALETVLRKRGYKDFTPGCSVAAAMPILSEGFM